MRARAPASTSNIGPGFDVLGLALSCYVEVRVEDAGHLEISATGEGAAIPRDAGHLAARIASEVRGHDRLFIEVHSEIPIERGLGSSAALALAAAAAAGAPDPLGVAARFDGHAENAAASLLGGLVAATFVEDVPVARRLALDPAIRCVVVVPDRTLSTHEARDALATEVAFGDAVFNLGRMGLLVSGLANASELVPESGDDRLHQDARSGLFPEARALMAALRAGGATVATWSGAGPSVLGICTSPERAGAARAAGEDALAELGLPGRVLELSPDRTGLELAP